MGVEPVGQRADDQARNKAILSAEQLQHKTGVSDAIAVLSAGFAKMDADLVAAKAAREQKLIVSPDEVRVGTLPGGQRIIVDR